MLRVKADYQIQHLLVDMVIIKRFPQSFLMVHFHSVEQGHQVFLVQALHWQHLYMIPYNFQLRIGQLLA